MTPRLFINDSRTENGQMFKLIALSLIIHLIAITTALITAPSASRHITFGQAYSVQLVGPEVMNFANESSAQNGTSQPTEATHPIIVKSNVSRLALAPVKKEDTDKPTIEKALGELRQKETQVPQAEPSSQTAVANIAPATGTSQARSRANAYYGYIQSKVKSNWILPPSLRPRENVVTIIEVKILSNGAVERLNFEKRSGNRYVDDSAMKAVQKSIPFPPFPQGMTDSYIEIGLRFPSSDLR